MKYPTLSQGNLDSITVGGSTFAVESFVTAANAVNARLLKSAKLEDNAIDIYDVLDMRVLSGLIGELLAVHLCEVIPSLYRNPNLDGYPDLCIADKAQRSEPLHSFLNYTRGGIEVKNTFGTKKPGVRLNQRESRKGRINRQLVWKAHHPNTNHLLAIQSDYIEKVPQIVRGFYCDYLTIDDWSVKQQPKEGSTMTSFCQTKTSAFEKLSQGVVFTWNEYWKR